jgi:hypothetical protein
MVLRVVELLMRGRGGVQELLQRVVRVTIVLEKKGGMRAALLWQRLRVRGAVQVGCQKELQVKVREGRKSRVVAQGGTSLPLRHRKEMGDGSGMVMSGGGWRWGVGECLGRRGGLEVWKGGM